LSDGREQLATGSIYLSLDSIANAFLGGIFWILVARLAAPDIVGRANIVVALISIAMTFTGLGFHLGASKYIAEHNAKRQFSLSRLVYSKTMRVTVLTSLAAASVLILTSYPMAAIAYRDLQFVPLIVIGAVSLPFQSLFRSLYGIYQGCHRMAYCLATDLVFLLSRLGLAVFLVLLGFGAMGIVLGFAVAYLASVMVSLAFLTPSLLPQAPRAESQTLFREIFRFSMLNYVAVIFFTVGTYAPIAILGIFRAPNAAAFYNIVLLAKLVVVAISTSVGLALLPTVSATVSRGMVDSVSGLYNLSIKSAILLSSVPILILFLNPSRILGLISEDYAIGGSLALQLLMVSTVASAVFGIAAPTLNGLNQPKKTFLATAVSSLLGLGVAFMVIPFWGVEGAAVANLAASVAGATLAVGLLAARSLLRLEVRSFLSPLLALALSLVVGELALAELGEPNIAIGVSLLSLLATSLLMRAFTLSELRTVLRLTAQRIRPRTFLRRGEANPEAEVGRRAS